MNCSGKMSFRDFIFPVNPSVIRISHSRHVTRTRKPFGEDIIAETGTGGRVVTGEGEFFGAEAASDFQRLRAVFDQGGTGSLYVPSQSPMAAFFESLELVGKDEEGVIHYTFRFAESRKHDGAGAVRVVVTDGQHCLWDYADAYGRDVEELMVLNPWVRRPDIRVTAGKELRLC